MNLAKLCIEGVSRVYVTSREGTKETNSGAVLLKNSLLTCYLILFVILTMAAPPNLSTFFQLHAVSRTQGGQRGRYVKILRSLFSAKLFEAFCVEWWNSTPGFYLGARAKK